MSSGFPDRHSCILLVMAGYLGLVPKRSVLERSPPSGVAKGILEYEETVKKFANPPAGNMTDHAGHLASNATMDKLAARALYRFAASPVKCQPKVSHL